jgi:hypothetical protein
MPLKNYEWDTGRVELCPASANHLIPGSTDGPFISNHASRKYTLGSKISVNNLV